MGDNVHTFVSDFRIAVGTRLNGIYEVDRPIASGGMGEIYEGHTVHTGDRVAIKVLRAEFSHNEAALALFRKEASALHNLQHDAIVRYYVCSIDPVLECPYLAMEFVEGETLSELLKRGPLPFEVVQRLAKRLAAGLQAAHRLGIVHRDVAPDNILIPNANVELAKIIDFGIARLTRAQDGTVIGSGFAGKYNYVSPEQLGLFGGNVTAKSDIYSLGLLLAAALRGRPLDMGGSQVEVLEKRRHLPDLNETDPRFRPLLKAMLQPDPADRPESMLAIADWPFPAVPTNMGTSAGRAVNSRQQPLKKGHWRYIAGAAVTVLIIAAIGSAVYRVQLPSRISGSQPPTPETASSPVSAPALSSQSPSHPTPKTATRVEEITNFLNGFDGGDCFFIMPIAVREDAAQIEGYGASLEPFQKLDDAFKRTNGFDADIGVRQVTPKQCPAINFLEGLRGRADKPRIDISDTNLRSGQILSGSIGPSAQDHLELLLVSDDGSVHNLSALAKPSGDVKVFKLRMQLANSNTAQPQLLIAIASSKPLAVLQPSETEAAQVFPAAVSEAKQTGQTISAAARYFQLQ
jgi:serine/threonine protein kinase